MDLYVFSNSSISVFDVVDPLQVLAFGADVCDFVDKIVLQPLTFGQDDYVL